MSIKTNLRGRVRNTSLAVGNSLMPLFESVVNSIHAIEELGSDFTSCSITVSILRSNQISLPHEKNERIPEEIIGFQITDDGIGFNDVNLKSFETLDSEHKIDRGGRGIGRLLWLKVFDDVKIRSVYETDDGLKGRTFAFDTVEGVKQLSEIKENLEKRETTVELRNVQEKYSTAVSKDMESIAKGLLEHCFWYFVRDGGCPTISVRDGSDEISLDDLYEQYTYEGISGEEVELKGHTFSITHIKARTSPSSTHTLSFCAAHRLVREENLSKQIPGMHSKLHDDEGEFIYSCYVNSSFLDERVRSERTGFDIEENVEGFLEGNEISLKMIREAIFPKIKQHLDKELDKNINDSHERIKKFVDEKAPRYRPILNRLDKDDFIIDPLATDKDLDIHLHKHLAGLEREILEKGHDILTPKPAESTEDYYQRVSSYLEGVYDLKKSDLAGYVCHRKVIIDLLEKALEKDEEGKYATEDIIHKYIMPMGEDSQSISLTDCNLWLLDEKLVFHNYLASDKTLNSMPITGSTEAKKPDICSVVYDNPILMSEKSSGPLASIVVIEIKRPMRNDARSGEENDPIEQTLGYLNRIREGKVQTSSGRPIPHSSDVPGYCYIVCDLTQSIKERCKIHDLTETSDRMGYFGYNKAYKAYIEVISFAGLIDSAKKRNKAFFDKLGLPTT